MPKILATQEAEIRRIAVIKLTGKSRKYSGVSRYR
jgi:hypothetical protein